MQAVVSNNQLAIWELSPHSAGASAHGVNGANAHSNPRKQPPEIVLGAVQCGFLYRLDKKK